MTATAQIDVAVYVSDGLGFLLHGYTFYMISQ